MSSDLHRAAQLGAGVLVSALFLSIGIVLVSGLNHEPAAWGGALMVTGASYLVAIWCAVRRDAARDNLHRGACGTTHQRATADQPRRVQEGESSHPPAARP